MRHVELAPGIKSSVLGFGCAPVLGSVDAATARAAIRAALDSGIVHFDLARSYGYGEAEKFVGREVRSVRDEVVIVTKFGIRATLAASLLRTFKPVVRALRPPKGKPAAGAPAASGEPKAGKRGLGDLFHQRLPMTPAALRQSLEQSLRALGTDRVESLLMHEPEELSRVDDLAACAEALKREGKIRSWGLASMPGRGVTRQAAGRIDLWQTGAPRSPADQQALLSARADEGLVLFSALAGVTAENVRPRLTTLRREFPRAVILCSMFNPKHIKENAAILSS